MFDICINLHFDNRIVFDTDNITLCLVAIIVHTYVLGDLSKPVITIAGVDRFY